MYLYTTFILAFDIMFAKYLSNAKYTIIII